MPNVPATIPKKQNVGDMAMTSGNTDGANSKKIEFVLSKV
jgi:hypothetical protein